jgi:hypothetical protein
MTTTCECCGRAIDSGTRCQWHVNGIIPAGSLWDGMPMTATSDNGFAEDYFEGEYR